MAIAGIERRVVGPRTWVKADRIHGRKKDFESDLASVHQVNYGLALGRQNDQERLESIGP